MRKLTQGHDRSLLLCSSPSSGISQPKTLQLKRGDPMSNPLFFRDVELLLIVIGGGFFGYLGYRLFIFGVTEGKSRFQAESKMVRLVFSGTAPGLFFMFAGSAILVAALFKGASHSESTQTTETKRITATPVSGAKVDASQTGDTSTSVGEVITVNTPPNALPSTETAGMAIVTSTSSTKTTTTKTDTKKH